MVINLHSVAVQGIDVDAETRCGHYKTELDIIAIKFRCCGEWFPCSECHAETTGHPPEVWPASEFNKKAILCGACGHQLAIDEYFGCEFVCPKCEARFNPGCANHYDLYFAADQRSKNGDN